MFMSCRRVNPILRFNACSQSPPYQAVIAKAAARSCADVTQPTESATPARSAPARRCRRRRSSMSKQSTL